MSNSVLTFCSLLDEVNYAIALHNNFQKISLAMNIYEVLSSLASFTSELNRNR